MLKIIIIALCLISISTAGLLPPYTYPAPEWPSKPAPEAPANYEFSYEVNEPSTGDIKQQKESAENGKVTGQYWLVEPDGETKRIVDYTADDTNGFIANVRYEKIKAAPIKPISGLYQTPKAWN
jgi:Insect cuticle protein